MDDDAPNLDHGRLDYLSTTVYDLLLSEVTRDISKSLDRGTLRPDQPVTSFAVALTGVLEGLAKALWSMSPPGSTPEEALEIVVTALTGVLELLEQDGVEPGNKMQPLLLMAAQLAASQGPVKN